MATETEIEILKLKLRIAELELALERSKSGLVYRPPTYPLTPDPLYSPPYIITCDTKQPTT